MRLNKADEIKIQEIANKHGLEFADVKDMIDSQYGLVKKVTSELNIPEGLDKEEFSNIKTNFNIPSLCKLHASHYIYTQINLKKSKKDL
tara:strand:- start:124 stop:390 length:267 start_codon:yes stop_codon:yes gene_type:complete